MEQRRTTKHKNDGEQICITIVMLFVHLHLERILVTNLDVHENCNTTPKEEYVKK
jgi:hypothetical protein